jgi:hypothetical protein
MGNMLACSKWKSQFTGGRGCPIPVGFEACRDGYGHVAPSAFTIFMRTIEYGAKEQVRLTDGMIDAFLKREFKRIGVTLDEVFDRGEATFNGVPELTLAKLEERIDTMIINGDVRWLADDILEWISTGEPPVRNSVVFTVKAQNRKTE